MHSAHTELLRCLFPLVRQAGDAILKIHKSGKLNESKKSDGTPVTLADHQAHKILKQGIENIAPDIPIISEEDSNFPATLPQRYFLLDPLDGTKEFIKGTNNFTVNIALIDNTHPILGVIYAPAHNRLFSGVVGEGAVESANGKAFSISVSTEPPKTGIRALTSSSHQDSKSLDYLHHHAITDIRPLGSSIKFCYLSNGEADIYPRFGPTMAWDTAAGDAILRSAGGTVINAETQQPLTYTATNFLNPSFIASGISLL